MLLSKGVTYGVPFMSTLFKFRGSNAAVSTRQNCIRCSSFKTVFEGNPSKKVCCAAPLSPRPHPRTTLVRVLPAAHPASRAGWGAEHTRAPIASTSCK